MDDLYKSIGVETEVMEATPHRLVQMMFEKCIDSINLSRHLIRENDIPKKCHLITQVLDIVAYLKSILNTEDESAKELSTHLINVYSYIENQLFMANLKNDTTYLDNALDKFKKIKESWDQIG